MNELTVTRSGKELTFTLPEGWELRDDLTQSDLEKWEDEYNKKPTKGRFNDFGAIVRASIVAKWFDECPIKASEVGAQHPRTIAQVARFVDAQYAEFTAVPDFLS